MYYTHTHIYINDPICSGSLENPDVHGLREFPELRHEARGMRQAGLCLKKGLEVPGNVLGLFLERKAVLGKNKSLWRGGWLKQGALSGNVRGGALHTCRPVMLLSRSAAAAEGTLPPAALLFALPCSVLSSKEV